MRSINIEEGLQEWCIKAIVVCDKDFGLWLESNKKKQW